MSQEKVNRYKAEKKNRKKGMNPDRKADIMINIFIAAVIIALSAFIIWSVYAKYFKKATPQKTDYSLTSGEIARIIDTHKEKASEKETESEAVSDSNADSNADSESNAESDATGNSDANAEDNAETNSEANE